MRAPLIIRFRRTIVAVLGRVLMFQRNCHGRRLRVRAGVPVALGTMVVTIATPSWAAPSPVSPFTAVQCDATGAALDAAIVAADASPAGSILRTLSLAKGCNYRFTTNGPAITHGAFGQSATQPIVGSLIIHGNGATISRFASPGIVDFRLLTVGPGASLTIDSVTIEGGRATCNGVTGNAAWCGAIAGDQVAAFGGGIGVIGGTLAVSRSKFIDNTATCAIDECESAAGGAIAGIPMDNVSTMSTPSAPSAPATPPTPSTMTISESTFTGNSATCKDADANATCVSATGGAIDATNSEVQISKSVLTENSVSCTNSGTSGIGRCFRAYGGAIDSTGDPSLGGFVLTESTLKNNRARADAIAAGGAVAVFQAVTAAIDRSTISDNSAFGTGTTSEAEGGGVFLQDPFSVQATTVTGGSIDHNFVSGPDFADGGGIACQGGNLALADLAITGNSASAVGLNSLAGGGGIASGCVLQADRTTIGHNSVKGSEALGGGLYSLGNTSLTTGRVIDNRASGVDIAGAGIYSLGGLPPIADTLTDETVTGNTGSASERAIGGGIDAEGVALTVVGGHVDGNVLAGTNSDGAYGGGIAHDVEDADPSALSVSGGATVDRNSVTANPDAGAHGGGIYAGTSGVNTVGHTSHVKGNSPDQCAPAGFVAGC
jgi:hypothetical protein